MEGLEKVVVDASVVVKWFNREEFTREALFLRDHIRQGRVLPFSPQLVIFEVANSLRYNPEFGIDDVQDTVKSILDMQIQILPLDHRTWRRAVEISFERGITVYDSVYVALAEGVEGTLWTADDKLVSKTGGMGRIAHIGGYR
jgi:predicted nucleic acid-binding protein